MDEQFFRGQIGRLRTRFGDRAFDNELVRLIAAEVHDMSEQGFLRFCDVMIGSRPHTKPPLLTEFREARLKESKRRFEDDLRGATNMLNRKAPEEMRKHRRLILSRDFGGVESVNDALEIARHNLQVAKADKGGA
jgi:hypothetical protein